MRTPWVGLLALAAMFLIPFLPNWLFEGPRTVRHWPRRHVCGRCGAAWTDGHSCIPAATLDPDEADQPVHGELRRLDQSAQLEPWWATVPVRPRWLTRSDT